MYLTAHHVASPVSGQEGVNAFLYLHDSTSPLPLTEIPEHSPGTLVAQAISLAPPGNLVLSYLDIVAPDDVRWERVRLGLMELVGEKRATRMPWAGELEGCYLRFSMAVRVKRQWQSELAVLYRSAQALHLAYLR